MDINGFWARDGHACTRTRTRVHAPLTVADRLIRLDMPRWLYVQAVLPRYQRLATILAPSTPFVNNVWAIACAREDARSILLGNWPVTRRTERVVRIDLVVFTLRGHRGLLMLVLDESAQTTWRPCFGYGRSRLPLKFQRECLPAMGVNVSQLLLTNKSRTFYKFSSCEKEVM